MTAHSHVADLIEILLNAVAQEARTTQDFLSVEIESVVTRGILEAFKRGGEHAHDRATEPPPRSTSSTRVPRIPTPAGPIPAVRPAPRRSRVQTPMPRDLRRDEDED